jgi:uncharacterized protein YegL
VSVAALCNHITALERDAGVRLESAVPVGAATFRVTEEPTAPGDERIAQWKASVSLLFEDGEPQDETAEAAAKRFEEIFAEGVCSFNGWWLSLSVSFCT